MKKRGLKRILTFISLGIVMLFSGLFFASCGPDPLSKISLSSSVEGDVLDLKVGESQEITFTINNYDKSIDPTLSFTLSDATSSQSKPNASNQSVHVQLEQLEQRGASTTVKVTALSGGTTTLVAKSAGDKSAYVTINVQGFASSLTLKQNAGLYVTQKTDFVPSGNLFEEFIEEERLSFYYVDDPEQAAPENQIKRVNLNDGTLTLTGLSGVTVTTMTAYEGQSVTLYAIYDNETEDKIIKAITFYVVSGFEDGENQIKVTDLSDNPLNQVLIIDNGEDETKQTIRITVPTAKFAGTENEYILFDSQINSEFIGSKTETQDGENERTYEITLSSLATSAVTTSLKLDLYYSFSGFDGKLIEGDPSLHQVLEIPVYVKIAPSSITVNSISAESPDNKYDLYNKYNEQEKYSNYGWHKLELKINRVGSEFDRVHMTFDSGDVVVRYQGQIVEGDYLDITNLSSALEIRGHADAEPFEEYKQIKFVVESSLLKPDKEISYNLNYRILKGSSPLTFADGAYYYTLERPADAQSNNGIFLSISGGEQIFYGLETDSKQYKVVSMNLREGENVALLAAGEQFSSTAYPNSLPIKINPLKVGTGIYELVLENGQNAILAIKVIETLEDVSVDLFGTNTKVQRMDRLTHENDYTDAIKLIIKNDSEGSRVNLRAFSRGSVLEAITSNMISGDGENSVVEVSIGENGEFAIITRGAGTSSFEIVAHGPAVKDFKKDGEATKKAYIEVTNYTPISSFKFYQDAALTQSARHIEKYVGDVTNASLQTAHIYSEVQPSSAYGFYDPRRDEMVDGLFSKEYIYFMITTAGHEAYMASQPDVTVTNMTMGNIYYIGYADHSLTNYLGLLNLKNPNDITFTFNPNRKEKASISFFAGIRQYESNLYFPIEIIGQEYLPVSRIYTNLQPDSPIIFEPGNEEADFTVFLSPKDATELALDGSGFNYISDGEGRDIIDVNQLEITEKGKGIYIIHARLNKAGDGAYASGRLTIYPKSTKSISVSVRFEYADGNVDNPYIITSAEQFVQKLQANPEANFLIRSSINLSPYSMPLLKEFKGTISGENNAQIMGVNITAGSSDIQNYGIFGTFSGKISNISISGAINVDLLSSDNLNIGLLCGVMEGVANNISISLQASSVSLNSGNVGALAGTIAEGGILINTNVVFSSFMQALVKEGNVYVGGIAGENNGNIYCLSDGNAKHGYSAYTAYALIDVRSTSTFGEMNGLNLAGNAGAIFAKGSGNIGFAQEDDATQSALKTLLGLEDVSADLIPSTIICGGEIFASNAGGVVCETSGALIGINSRTKVRGKTVGLIGTNISSNSNNQNISVEATEDGETIKLAASMGVLFSDISTFNSLSAGEKQNYALFNSEQTILTVDPIVSYVSHVREHIGYNSTETASNKNYYGDYIVVALDGSPLPTLEKEDVSLVFKARSADFSLAAKLGELTTTDVNAPKVFYAYYFAVKGYMDGDEYKEYDLESTRNEISALNKVSMDSPLYPFTISNDDVSISSLSDNVKIDPDGTLTFSGEGIAKMQISSLLNGGSSEIFYIYVINYFDSTNESIFTSGELPLGTNTQINSFTKSSAFVSLNPTYSLNEKGFSCSQNGVITLNNGKLVYLQPNKSLKIRATTSDDGADNFGSLKYTNGQISFIKKPNAITTEHGIMTTSYNLTAYLEVTVDGHTYTHTFASLDDVKVNYYEGATDVKSNKSNYVVYPSIGTSDEWEIVSDLSTDAISNSKFEFYNSRGKKVEGFECSCPITNLSGKMSLSLKQGANLEYGDYEMRVFTTSSGDEAVKSFKISLLREELSISMVNYPSLSSFIDKGESDKIEIGLTGLFSITFMPLSDNFDYFEISNNAANSLAGSSMGSFEIGKLQVSDSGYQFVAFNDVQNINGTLRVTKDVLNKNAVGGRFDGQVFVRYLFASQMAGNTAIVGSKVTIDVFVHEPDDESQNVTKSFTYTLAKSNLVSISISGDPNKTQIAKGVQYALDVTAQGFEDVEVSSASSYVEITQENGRYSLIVPNEKEIAYPANGGYSVNIDLKATRTNAFGEKDEATDSISLEILEYVINTYDQNSSIVKGVNNKVLSTAIGEMVPLELDLEKYVEASPQNMPLAREFISGLRAQGEWKLFTDLNENNEDGAQLGTVPTTMSRLGQNVKIKTQYFMIDGFNLTTLKSNDVTSTEIRDNHYYFTFEAKSKIEKGVYKFDSNGDRTFSDLFFVDASRRGSIESPNPIYTYEDFVKMERDKYYIQLADIVVPSNFAFPEEIAGGGVEYGEVAYFDGNGKEFIFNSPNENGIYDLGTQTSVGLFNRISNRSLIKNVTIRLGDTRNNNVIFSTTAQSLSFGLLAGENNGIVTNVRVYNAIGGEMALNLANGVQPATASYYFAGIVGGNNGYLTHCTSEIKVRSYANLAGIASRNYGTIASSKFINGRLDCLFSSTSLEDAGVGGLVVVNEENGKILTSYTSGVINPSLPYSNDISSSYIKSGVAAGGFAYINSGTITDSYASMPMISGLCSGFVYYNNGSIARCFSTSNMTNPNTFRSYYFAGNSVGQFDDCFYLKGYTSNDPNYSLAPIEFVGQEGEVSPIIYASSDASKNEFTYENITNIFSTYAFGTTPSYDHVWFYANGSQQAALFNGKQFASGRLELVSANIDASSQKRLYSSEPDENGEPNYVYETESGSNADGSEYNPYIIFSAETMEDYLYSSNGISDKNYRIVCDIDYSSNRATKLYTMVFSGRLEGNGATISEVEISSSEVLSGGGLFREISGNANKYSTVMNLTIQPRSVFFTHANLVGTLSGTLSYASLYNISVSGMQSGNAQQTQTISATGLNLVGGVIGLAKNNYELKNIIVNIGAVATKLPNFEEEQIYSSGSEEEIASLSYAGGLAGYLAGSGNVDTLNVATMATSVVGCRAGFVFGGIGESATVKNTVLQIDALSRIKPYKYGGFVVGELSGTLDDVRVYSSEQSGGDNYISDLDSLPATFAIEPYVAEAVGGIAGIAEGVRAKINMAYMGHSFKIEGAKQAFVQINTINYVGGIVGKVKNSLTITKSIMDGNICAKNVLGGAVGELDTGANLNITEIKVDHVKLLVNDQNISPINGGMVGQVQPTCYVNITNSYSTAEICMETYGYSSNIDVKVSDVIASIENTPGQAEAVIKLTNVFTTSIFNLTVEDATSTDPTQKVSRYHYTLGNEVKYQDYGVLDDGTGYGGTQEVKSQAGKVGDHQEYKLIEYRFNNGGSAVTATNVFNLSLSGYDKDTLNKGFTTLYSRKHNSSITITQNEYGNSLQSLSLASETLTPEEAIKALMKHLANPDEDGSTASRLLSDEVWILTVSEIGETKEYNFKLSFEDVLKK